MIRQLAALPLRFISVLFVALGLLGWSCEESVQDVTIEPGSTVLAALNQQEELQIFADALERAGISSSLQNQNINFTLFAPSNAAFTTYLQANGFASIQDVPEEALENLVNYHLAYGNLPAASLDSALLVDTFDDRKIFVYTTGNAPAITLNNQAQVVESYTEARNGVIHQLDEVLTPPTQSLGAFIAAQASSAEPEYSRLYAALERAELLELISNNKNSYTLLAPTDAAFAAAGFATDEDIQNADPALLKNILLYHLLPRYRFSFMLPTGDVTTQQGKKVSFNAGAKTVKGGGNTQPANLLANELDQLTANGVIHAIDAVLLPPL